jgi:hypothetical protein
MVTLTEYAVRVKGTQKYLPRSQRRDGRGGSHLEPVDFTDRSSWPKGYEKNMQIRTYTTRAAAENLLRCWCEGKWYGDDEGGGYLIKDEHRRFMGLEVVELAITLPRA